MTMLGHRIAYHARRVASHSTITAPGYAPRAAKAPGNRFEPGDVETISLSQDAKRINEILWGTAKPLVFFVDDKAKYDDGYLPGVLGVLSSRPDVGSASGLVKTKGGKALSFEDDARAKLVFYDAARDFRRTRIIPAGTVYRTDVIRGARLRFDEDLTYCRDELFAIRYAELSGKTAYANRFVYKAGIIFDEESTNPPQADDRRWYFDSAETLMDKLRSSDGTLSKSAQFGLLYLAVQRFRANQNGLIKMCFESLDDSGAYLRELGTVTRAISDDVMFCRTEAISWERNKRLAVAQLRDPGSQLPLAVSMSPLDASVRIAGSDSKEEICRLSEQHCTVICMDAEKQDDGTTALHMKLRMARCFPLEGRHLILTNRYGGKNHVHEALPTGERGGLVSFFDREMAHIDIFETRIPLDPDNGKQVISLAVKIGRRDFAKKIEFSNDAWQNKLNTADPYCYWRLDEGTIVRNADGKIVIEPATEADFAAAEKKLQSHLAELAKKTKAEQLPIEPFSLNPAQRKQVLEWRKAYWDTLDEFADRRIWAYYDKAYKAGDNGEHAFRYAAAQDDGIEKIFFIDPDCPDGKRLAEEGHAVMTPGTREAALVAMHAEVIFMTHVPPYFKLGIHTRMLPYLKDLLDAKVIRMYHGYPITCSASYAQSSNNACAVVVGSTYERDLYTSPEYGFAQEQIIESGCPRYDDLLDDRRHQILIAPTWRPALAGKNNAQGIPQHNPRFTESAYYKTYERLLNDERLLACAREYGYTLKLYLHPTMASQTCDFEPNDVSEALSCVDDIDYVTIMRQSDLMVTDYSSVAFDFASMRKPVVFYQDTALPYWRLVNFDYGECGIGEVCHEYDRLVEILCESIRNDCKLDEERRAAMDAFFLHDDQLASQRLYEAALALVSKS